MRCIMSGAVNDKLSDDLNEYHESSKGSAE